MRKLFILLAIMMMSTSILLAQDANFRDASWGMSKAEVKEAEDKQLLQEKVDVLYYADTMEDQQMYVIYKFAGEEKQLHQGQYILQSELTNESQYIDFYKVLESNYRDQYGSPRVDTTLVQAEKYMGSPSQYSSGLKSGDVRFQTSWDTKETEILMQLWNGNRGIQLAIQYIDKNA